MVDTAAWLVDRVIPQVPVQQWVLSLPYRVRHVCAYDAGGVRCCWRLTRSPPRQAELPFEG